MLPELQFTDARKSLTSAYNTVFGRGRPVVVARKRNEKVIMLREDLQKLALSPFSLKPEIIEEDDGSVTLAIDHLELVVNGRSLDDAVLELVNELKLYAQDYFERSELFLNSPNRRAHFPYLLRVALCDSDEEIKGLLEI